MIDWKLVEELWGEPIKEIIKEKTMVKRTYTTDENEPEQSNFKIPSEGEKLMQITDVIEPNNIKYQEFNPDIYTIKLEIIGGDDEGLTLLNRVNLNQEEKSFYFTRLFLKAIGEPYKGAFEIDTDNFVGKQFYATVKHSKSKDGTKTYANISEYNFDKKIEQYKPPVGQVNNPEDIAWNE